MSDIFLSYSRDDAPTANLIVAALEGQGWSVWWDRKTVPGDAFDQEIEKELASARCVVVLWSTESLGSAWVRAEADQARRRGILIPVLIDDVAMPVQFQMIQAVRWVEARKASSIPDAGELLDAVALKLRAPVRERSVKPPRPDLARRKKLLTAAGGIALVVLVALLGWLWFRTASTQGGSAKAERKESAGGKPSNEERRAELRSIARELGVPLAEIDLALDRSADPLVRGHVERARGACLAAARHFAQVLKEKEHLLEGDDALPKNERADRRKRATEVAVWLADAYSCAGQYEEALTVVRKILKANPDDTEQLNRLGQTYLQVADFSEAGRRFEQAIRELEKTRKETDPFLLAVSMNLAQAQFGEGKLKEAADLAERTVAIEEKALPADHPDTLAGLHVLGNLRFELGDPAGAKELQERLLATCIRLSGPEDDMSLIAENDLARTFGMLGDHRAALGHLQHVLEVWQRTRGPDHPEVLIVRTGLARTLLALGRIDDAQREAERAVRGLTRNRGPNDPETLIARDQLADIERTRGNYQTELEGYEATLEARRKMLSADDSEITISEVNYSRALFDVGELGKARELQERLVEKAKRQLGPDHGYTLSATFHLAATLVQVGEPARAVRLLEDLAKKRAKSLGNDHPTTLVTRQRLAAALRAAGKPAQARKIDLEVISSPLGEDHPTVLAARADLALILRGDADLAGARKLQDDVLTRWTRARGAEHPVTLQVRCQRAETLAAQGELAAARTELEAVASLQAKRLGPHHPDTVATEWALVGVLERLKEETDAAELRRSLRWLLAEPPGGLSTIERAIIAALKTAG
jgi:tetratricopeptide (TPR) repeat protein